MLLEEIFFQKKELRKYIARKKAKFSPAELKDLSREIMHRLEQVDGFQKAKIVLAYHSTADEVCTHELIDKYKGEKTILLPVVTKDGLVLKKYISDDHLMKSAYGILEPTGEVFANYDQIDLVIVPGVAFDRLKNRLGHGKAYYDGLLPRIKAQKVAVCFDFQLFDSIPNTLNDVNMDIIVCQKEEIY